MNKRAKEVADRFKTRQSDLRSFSRRTLFLLLGPERFSYWSIGVRVNIAPVGGRLSLFVAQWQNITRDHFIFSVVRQGFSDFSSIQFSGGVTGSHHTPQGSKSSPSYLQRNPRVDSKENHRPNRRFFFITLLFTYFCDSQENGIFG